MSIKRSESASSINLHDQLKVVLKLIVNRTSGRNRDDIPSAKISELHNSSKCSSISENNSIYFSMNSVESQQEPKTKTYKTSTKNKLKNEIEIKLEITDDGCVELTNRKSRTTRNGIALNSTFLPDKQEGAQSVQSPNISLDETNLSKNSQEDSHSGHLNNLVNMSTEEPILDTSVNDTTIAVDQSISKTSTNNSKIINKSITKHLEKSNTTYPLNNSDRQYFVPKLRRSSPKYEAAIIHELVLEKFKERLKKHKVTYINSSNRCDMNEIRKCSDKQNQTSRHSLEVEQKENSTGDDREISANTSKMLREISKKKERQKSTDSGFDTSGDILGTNKNSRAAPTSTDTDTYFDEKDFLKTALGEYINSSTNTDENSMGTTDISLLLSRQSLPVTSTRRTRNVPRHASRPVKSLFIDTISYKDITYEVPSSSTNRISQYSTVNKSMKNKTRNIFPSYEEVFEHTKEFAPPPTIKADNIDQEIVTQTEINEQAKKALQFGWTRKHFMGSPIHLELEKILLVSSIKKSVFQKYANQTEYQNLDAVENSGSVTIKNIKFTLDHPECCSNINDNHNYFLCILKSENAVFATKIVSQIENNQVIFDDEQFVFDNLTYEFQIDVVLYSLKTGKSIKRPCFLLCSSPTSIPESNFYPSFNSVGQTQLSLDNVNDKELPKLEADISYKVNVNADLRGFLTIGTERQGGCPLWNRRWCILEGFVLKCFDYPSDEILGKPAGIIDLKYCASNKIEQTSIRECPRSFTLLMEIVKHQVKVKYFLSADNKFDFMLWEAKLNAILDIIFNWKLK